MRRRHHGSVREQRLPAARDGRTTPPMLALSVILGTIACAPAPAPVGDSATGDATTASAVVASPPDSATFAAATRTLAAFLEASREGSVTRSALPELTACPGWDGTTLAGPMLAGYELLRPAARGDTVVGRAVVTTVAEQDVDRRHPGYYVARVRVRTDTLEWDVVPDGNGTWVVCNGLSFGLTAPDSLTAWRPEGTSRATARALADSIASVFPSRAAPDRQTHR